MSYIGSYGWKMRKAVGSETIFWPGAKCILETQAGLIALVRRADNGRYAIPGGYLELGEHPGDAIRREMLEELNVVISPNLFGIIADPKVTYFRHPSGDQVESINFLYRAKLDADLSLSDVENDHFEFLSTKDAKVRVSGMSRVMIDMYEAWRTSGTLQVC